MFYWSTYKINTNFSLLFLLLVYINGIKLAKFGLLNDRRHNYTDEDANYLLNNVTLEVHKYVIDKVPQNTDDFIFMQHICLRFSLDRIS